MKELSMSARLLLRALTQMSDEIADLQDKIIDLRSSRDDLIREGVTMGLTKAQVARAADLSVEQIRNVESFRYSRETRRKKNRNPGPPRD